MYDALEKLHITQGQIQAGITTLLWHWRIVTAVDLPTEY